VGSACIITFVVGVVGSSSLVDEAKVVGRIATGAGIIGGSGGFSQASMSANMGSFCRCLGRRSGNIDGVTKNDEAKPEGITCERGDATGGGGGGKRCTGRTVMGNIPVGLVVDGSTV